eukprot:m.176280 g.176280  ORF g.176280 m.176280 type:complete len:248 (-) comp15441_c0_seq10:2804-3547(-)
MATCTVILVLLMSPFAATTQYRGYGSTGSNSVESNKGPQAPQLPLWWSHQGTQELALPLPPFDLDNAPVPRITTSMESYYDWTQYAMREIYHDECVPIFRNGSQWSCDFLNVNKISYLVLHEDRPQDYPECCVFLDPWVPPKPDFPSTLPFLKNTTLQDGSTVMWWQSTNVPPSEGGPFGYGFHENGKGDLIPYAFYFGAFWNYANGTIGQAFTEQYFTNFTIGKPPPSIWELPPACSGAKKCSFWP